MFHQITFKKPLSKELRLLSVFRPCCRFYDHRLIRLLRL